MSENNDADIPVILFEGLMQKETYGILEKDEKRSIVENLLQSDITIEFETEEEKEKIISIIPTNFQVQIKEKTIIITFEKEEIEAQAYHKFISSDFYGRSSEYFEDLGIKKIKGTIRTPELKKSIDKPKLNIHQIRAEIYKKDTDTYNEDKIKATSNIEEFFKWLIKTGEIEIIDTQLKSGKGAEVWPGVRRTYTDKHIQYKFKGEDEIYTLIESDGDFLQADKYGQRIKKIYDEFIEEMKKNGEYYIQGTSVPRHIITEENGIYYSEESNNDNRSAVILKNGEPCLILNDVENNHRNKFCKDKTKQCIYVSTENNPKGYEELPLEECLIRS